MSYVSARGYQSYTVSTDSVLDESLYESQTLTETLDEIYNAASVHSVTGPLVDNSDPKNPEIRAPAHFGAYTTNTIAISTDPNNPTYLTGVALFPSATPGIIVLDAATGLLRNDTGFTLTMQGSVTYQTAQGAGGRADLHLWSERSNDDGVTFVENTFSLRTSEVPNNADSSQTKSSAISDWENGQSARWAMYNVGPGSLTLAAPSDTVNNGNAITGLSFYWQLNEV
jgi:hypothetical protein